MIETRIDPRVLRGALGRFTTGVVVVTAQTDQGLPFGMTVNSFTSVSLEPPIVLFCVSRASQLHPLFTSGSDFAINVLAESQKALSLCFAKPGLDRFGILAYQTGRNGVPVLPGALAVLECAKVQVVEAGDHDIVLGSVEALTTGQEPLPDPLVFFAGAYRRLDHQHADWWTAFT